MIRALDGDATRQTIGSNKQWSTSSACEDEKTPSTMLQDVLSEHERPLRAAYCSRDYPLVQL